MEEKKCSILIRYWILNKPLYNCVVELSLIPTKERKKITTTTISSTGLLKIYILSTDKANNASKTCVKTINFKSTQLIWRSDIEISNMMFVQNNFTLCYNNCTYEMERMKITTRYLYKFMCYLYIIIKKRTAKRLSRCLNNLM